MPGGDAAVLLALDEQRVDHRAAVVDGDVAHELDPAGLEVDLDDGDVGAERERRVALVEVASGLERGRRRRRDAGGVLPRRARPRSERVAGTPATPTVPASVSTTMSATSASSRWAASCLALLDQRLGGLVHGRAAELQRARAARAAAPGTRSVSPSTSGSARPGCRSGR